MCLHDSELLCIKPSGFEQDVVRDAELSHIVEEGAFDQDTQFCISKANNFTDTCGVKSYPIVVAICVAVALGNGTTQDRQSFKVSIKQMRRIISQTPCKSDDDRV